ncbi:putative esr1 protein [Danaus plexippus plexippus]|uniref:Serine/threonine-protein kinase ATR n=1 Tax=Danaus plexippus plexippus TaxID=278856 RepID=A0A212FIV4_DANPL|nr:putative esr1 protein [Danaus plexippus plexippus]
MEEESDGPFNVWQMFNAPINVLFQNLEHAEDGLVNLLTSILKLSGDLSEVLVPRPGGFNCPESYYCAFNTWLIGRLFYISSVEVLHRIHETSKDAQLKILNILCFNGASFYKKIHSEYYTIITNLLQFYCDYARSNETELLIQNFTPEQVQIPNVNIKLEPIYVKVNDLATCKTLISINLRLLAESIPPSLLCNMTGHENGIFDKILNAIENFSIDMKLAGLKFFNNLIMNISKVPVSEFQEMFPNIYNNLLLIMKALIQTLNVLHDKGEIDNMMLIDFNLLYMELIKIVGDSLKIEHRDDYTDICNVVLSNTSNRIFNKDLKLLCLSMSGKINLNDDFTNIVDMDCDEIKCLADFYCSHIVEHINTKRIKDKATDFNENIYLNRIISVITSVKACDQPNIDIFLMNHHLSRCLSALSVLEKVIIENVYKLETNMISKQEIKLVWLTLVRLVKEKKSVIISNETSTKLVMNIIVSTASLQTDLIADDVNIVLQLICFQDSHMFTEQNFLFTNNIKLNILKYLLVNKLIISKNPAHEKWNKIITFLYSSLMRNKDSLQSKQIIEICPLFLVNKILSASKIIGEILIPAFMSKETRCQIEVLRILPAIVCISLGHYDIVKTVSSGNSQEIFSNENFSLNVICKKCHDTTIKNSKIVHKETEMLNFSNTSYLSGLQSLFVKFINTKDTEFGTDYWNLVERLCNHYYIFDHGVSTDIMQEKYLDDVLKTFKPFINVQNNKGQDWISNRDMIMNLCVNLLVKSTITSLENNDYNHQTQTLDRIKSLGLCNNEKLILPITKLLVYFIMHPQCSLAPKAIVYLRDVCEFQDLTPNQVYHRYKKDFCKLFVECSLYNGKDFAIFLLKVVRAFGFVGYRDFISKDIHHFLPYLIPYSVTVKEVPSMIEEIAVLVQCSVSDFLIERFPHIYVHVYLTESKETAKKCFDIIERLTKTSTLNLIKKHLRVILTEFLLQYCCNPQKVLEACKYLAYHDLDASSSQGNILKSSAQVADFLNPKFLGVLAYFDHKLVNAKVALSVKRKALKSFSAIMQLMGTRYLTPLRFKILATLRSALPLAKEFPIILAEAWSAFIHNIDSSSLGPLLSNLAAPLLHQMDYAPNEINSIFQYMILKNENLLSSHISNLFFLEDSNVSDNVRAVIKRHVKRSQPESFQDQIKWYLQHLNHDIPIIKANVFCHMEKLLKNNRSEIHRSIFGGRAIEAVIVELIDSLLIGCKDINPQVSLASGSCLGQLGAIEAGHLPRQYVQPDRSPFAFSINDDCFAATALTELARAFQYEKDTMNMDCYALSIQEILKTYGISPNGSKKEVWDSFSENMHQLMSPLLSSRYTLAYPSQPKKVHPLFGSMYATTFLEWAHNWSGQLIDVVESDSIKDLLRTVHPSMRRDVRTLFLFLPYVLLHAIMSKNNIRYIQEEILAVIGGQHSNNDRSVSTERSKYKILKHIKMTPNINPVHTEEGNQTKCSKTIYTLFDFLNRWLLEWTNVKQKPLENDNYKAIKKFMDSFDKLAIARGNYACGELERALQYLEMYMDEDKDRIQEQLPFLAEIYALLDEPDSVSGILSIQRAEPSLQELILVQVVTGRLQDAALCYERLAHRHLDEHSLQGMTDCYLALDQPFTALRLLSERQDEPPVELSAEPLWRLGRFEQLEHLTNTPVPPSRENWGLLMGRILLAYRKQDEDLFKVTCDNAINRLLLQMDGESQGENALRGGYQSVLGLHIVKEVQHAQELLHSLKNLQDGNEQSTEMINTLLSEWRLRLAVVQSDVRTIEPLLRLRRILLQQTQELLEPTHAATANKLKACIGNFWLQSAKHARKAGIFQQSYMYILNAEEYKPPELFIEKAKMYWSRGQHESAFTTLKRGLEEAFPSTDTLTPEQRKTCAKAKLLIAKYNDETSSVDVNVNINYYKESVDAFEHWEKSLVCLGAYYEKVSSIDTNTKMMWSRRLYALNSYGKSLQYGHKYLYQSMPRMLSIWLDVEVSSADPNSHAIVTQMTEVIKTYSEKLPIYLYFTAFSQIISRICHPKIEVYNQLKAIIVKLLAAYPQQSLWMMLCVLKSSYPARVARCEQVLADARLKPLGKLVRDFKQLAEKLIELCNKPIAGKVMTATVSSLVPTLPRLLESESFSHIMMPFQEFCKIVLPSKAASDMPLAGIQEQLTRLPSLQQPRKVTLIGSDGKKYIIMLKPKDDLRKDFRLMEFNGVVNKFLQDAPETRKRRLYIRTYSVLPLNEECGLIEWVPNLVGLRPILIHIYKQKGIQTSNSELRKMMCSSSDSVEKKRDIYERLLLPRHPPVFQEWFRKTFSDPYGWYQARSAYIRTTAVMSIVGYILGLGDRHGENISFDSTNGDTVHVDFNCLFNRGESFEWPERVPFRLTHNMQAAMGPLKHDGMYRKCCEAVTRVLRSQTEALMSVVGPFVYDPLVAWNKRHDTGERTNDQAKLHLKHILQRLRGMVKTKNTEFSLSLSPEGLVEHLIAEATSVHNLCQMYIGWGSFL